VVPVVVCVWKRPHRLAETIDSLAAQSHAAIKLGIWNNSRSLRSMFESTIARVSDIDIDIVHSERNIGGFGRFYFARQLVHDHDRVVFIDDDQVPGPGFIESLVGEFKSQTFSGTWGYRFRGTRHYGDRVAAESGERIKYCGTGGMICDTRIFLEAGLFKCPRRFWFVEDLWLSYYADHVLRWPLYKSGAEISTDSDEYDQCNVLGGTKDRLFRYLVRRGWDPVANSPA
jgi:cellulose synthase/poly-beta-1,6-N-acetylglucosamine synthase-like glycosyltransferase